MMNTSATEFALVLVASMLIAQAFAVGCLWLFVEFIRAPEHIDDWYEETDDEEIQPGLLERLEATRLRLLSDQDGPPEN